MGKESTLLPLFYLEQGLIKAKSVGRITLATGGLGTGFLLDNNYVLTNNHVLENKDSARNAFIEFKPISIFKNIRNLFIFFFNIFKK